MTHTDSASPAPASEIETEDHVALGEDYALTASFVEKVVDAADDGDGMRLRGLLEDLHPADVADLMGFLTAEHRAVVVQWLPPDLLADTLPELDDGIREEVLEQRFAGLLRQLRFDDAAFELIQRALRESLQDETRERRAAIERLRGEADRLQARIERMYEDKLDGVISDDFYRRMQIVWREERDRCLKDIERHHSADDEYIDNGIALIRLGREANDLFERASASEKRRVLNLVLSNCSWAHGELTAKFRQPFDLLSETIAQSTLPKKGETGDLAENEKWLRG